MCRTRNTDSRAILSNNKNVEYLNKLIIFFLSLLISFINVTNKKDEITKKFLKGKPLIPSPKYVGIFFYIYLTWLACESLRDLFPAGATDVLPSVRRSYLLRLPDFPYMALVDPGWSYGQRPNCPARDLNLRPFWPFWFTSQTP